MSNQAQLFDEDDSNIDKDINAVEANLQGDSKTKRSFINFKGDSPEFKLHILPKLAGQPLPWIHYMVHTGLTKKDGSPMAIQCSQSKYGECPLCIDAAIDKSSEAWRKKAQAFYLYNVVDQAGVFHVMSAYKGLQKELIKCFKHLRSGDASADGEGFNPWSFKGGCYLKITKTKGERKGGSKFASNIFSVFNLARAPLNDMIIDAAKDQVTDLSKIYKDFTPEEIDGMMDGTFDPYASDTEFPPKDNYMAPKEKSQPVESPRAKQKRIMEEEDDVPESVTAPIHTPVKPKEFKAPAVKGLDKVVLEEEEEIAPTPKVVKKAAGRPPLKRVANLDAALEDADLIDSEINNSLDEMDEDL